MQEEEDILRDIRKRCRQSMNGVVSTSMRQWGLSYKVNFGLTIAQIKDISLRYPQKASLAETLWKENTRELKILATLLYPINEYTEHEANKWVEEIPNQEIREQLCFNLLQELSFASNLAMEWAKFEKESTRTSGYWLLSRLLIAKKIKNADIKALTYIWNDIISENSSLRNASLLALKHIGRLSQEMVVEIMQNISEYKNSENRLKQEAYQSLEFEFSFFFEN